MNTRFCKISYNSKKHKKFSMSRLYLEAASVLEKVFREKSGLKSAVYASKCAPKQKPSLLALVSKAFANQKLLNQALTAIGAFKTESKMRRGLLVVMLTELIYGSGVINGGGQVKKFLMGHVDELRSKFEGKIPKHSTKSESAVLPRYVRVNPTRWKSIDAAISHLVKNGISDPKKDENIPNLLVIDPCFTRTLVALESVKRGDIILQDKSTCVSAFALLNDRPPLPSLPIHVMDVCAAPGGKTIHILEKLRPGDFLTAVEMDEKRVKILEERIAALGDIKKGVTVKVIKEDFLKLFADDARLTTTIPVTHINLDPSCSGSGMDGPKTNGKKQLQSLASFQSMMLKHAQNAFDKVQTICYSTCSVFSVENEEVVTSTVSPQFEIHPQPLPSEWWTPSDDSFIRTSPDTHKCRGFFLAKLVRK